MALLKTNTGIGTTNPTSSLHVIGDVLVTGVVTSTAFNGNINSGIGTIVNLSNTQLTSGIGTINNITNNFINSGVGTVNILNTGIGTVKNLNSEYLNVSGVGSVSNLHSPNAAINVGVITNLTNTRLTSGIATITDLDVTNSSFVNVNVDNFYAVSGVVTDISGSNLNYTGVGTITTFDSDISTINNIISDYINVGVSTAAILNSGIGTIIDLNGSLLNIIGVGTIATLNSTYTNLTNINSTGISTLADIRSERVTVTGIVTANSFRPTSGYIQAADGTNAFYIYDNTGNVAFQGTIGVNQINNASGFQVLTFNNLDTRLTGNLDIAGVTTSSVFNGNIYSLGVSTFRNGPVLIGIASSTGTSFQPLQVTGGVYVSDNLGLGITNPTSKLDVVGDGRFTGVITATTFNGDINAGVSTLGIATATNLTSQQLIVSGLSTFIGVTTFQNDVYINGDLYVTDDLVFDEFTSRNINVTGVATIFNLVGTAATITDFNNTTSTIADLNNTRLTSGIATITNLDVTNSTFINLNADNAFVDVGIVTDISGTRLTYTGVGTITTLDTDTATINNLSGDYANVGVATITILNSGIGTITDLNNTRFVSGIATITDLDVTNSTFTNLNTTNLNAVTGIVTDISGTRLTYTGVGTITTLDTDTATINNLTSDYINAGVTTTSILNSGIGTITDLNNTRFVSGIATITTIDATNIVSTNSDFTNLNADIANIDVGIVTDISGVRLNYTGIGTIETLDTTNATIDYITNTDLVVSGIATIQNLDVQGNFDVYDTTATFHNNVFISGNLSIGGTTTVITTADLRVIDKEIILGITTNAFDQDVSNDVTASHGGIAIASTEGYPLVDLSLAGFSSLPPTYKQLMWVAANSYGFGTTDAWMFNYAVGIGSTIVPNDVRLAVGNVQITDKQIVAVTGEFGRINSGIATFTGADIGNLHSNNLFSQSGIITDLSGTRLNYTGFGTITNLYSNLGYIENVSSNIGFATVFATERLNVTGVGTIATLDSTTSTITDLNVTNSSFSNVNANNLYAVTGIVTTLTSTHSTLENINSAGISTLNIVRTNTIISSGVVTAPTFVGDLLGVANYAHISGFSTFSGYSNTSGFSTFSGYSDSSGVSTFSGYSDTAGFSTFSGYANASGVSTFADYANNAGIATYAWTAGVSTYSGVSGFSTFSGYSDTSGFSTFSGYSNNAGIATYAWTAGVSTYSGVSGFSTFSGYSDTSGFSTFSGYSNTSGFSTFSGYSDTTGFSTFSGYANASGVSTFADYANNAGIATYAWTAGVSTYSGVSGFSTFSGYSDTAGFSTFSGYSNTSGFSTFSGYANASGVSTFADYSIVSGFSTFSGYSNTSGVSTSVIGGLVSVNELNVTGVATIGQVQITSTGIITSVNPGVTTVVYYGDGSNLIGVNAFNVISQDLTTNPVYPTFASNIGVASIGINSTQVAYIPSTNSFGIGTTEPRYTLEIVGNARVSGVTSVTNLEIYGTVGVGSTVGFDGQYLRSTGVGVTWASFPTLRTVGIETAGSGQTTFNFTYNVGFLDVYVNGVKLTNSEYIANNGVTIVLISPTFAGDIVEFVSYNTVSSGGSGVVGATALNDLSDVSISPPEKGDNFAYDGIQWVNDYTINTSTTTTSQSVIHTLPTSTYRSVEYMIQATQGTNYHLTKILAISDGSFAYSTEYGSIYTNASLGTFDVDVSGGNIRLLVTPASSSFTTYKIKFTSIKV